MEINESGLGKVNISAEFIANITGYAAMECYGLVGMGSRKLKDGIAELLKMDNLSKGVEVTFIDTKVIIDLYVIVEYGIKISEVAHNLMDKIKYSVENTTGLEVQDVNIHVQGVRLRSAK